MKSETQKIQPGESTLYCPVCLKNGKSSTYRLYKINTVESVSLCEERTCLYPVGNYESYVYSKKSCVSPNINYENAQSLYTMGAMFLTGESTCSDNFVVLEYIISTLKSVQECTEILKLKGSDIIIKAEKLYDEMIANRGSFNWLSINCVQNERSTNLSKFVINIAHFCSLMKDTYKFDSACTVEECAATVIKNKINLDSNDFSTVILHLLEVYNLAELKYTAYLSIYHEEIFKKYEYLINSFPNLYSLQKKSTYSQLQNDCASGNDNMEIADKVQCITNILKELTKDNESSNFNEEETGLVKVNVHLSLENEKHVNLQNENEFHNSMACDESLQSSGVNIKNTESIYKQDKKSLTILEDRHLQKIEYRITLDKNNLPTSMDALKEKEMKKNKSKTKNDNCTIMTLSETIKNNDSPVHVEQLNEFKPTSNDTHIICTSLPDLSDFNLCTNVDNSVTQNKQACNKEQRKLDNKKEVKIQKSKKDEIKLDITNKSGTANDTKLLCLSKINNEKESNKFATDLVETNLECNSTQKKIETQLSPLLTNNSNVISEKNNLDENVNFLSNITTCNDNKMETGTNADSEDFLSKLLDDKVVNSLKTPTKKETSFSKKKLTPGKHISEDDKAPVYKICINSESNDEAGDTESVANNKVSPQHVNKIDVSENTRSNNSYQSDDIEFNVCLPTKIDDNSNPRVSDDEITVENEEKDIKTVDNKPFSINLIDNAVAGKIATSIGDISWNIDLTGIDVKQYDDGVKADKSETLPDESKITYKKCANNSKINTWNRNKPIENKKKIKLIMKPVTVSAIAIDSSKLKRNSKKLIIKPTNHNRNSKSRKRKSKIVLDDSDDEISPVSSPTVPKRKGKVTENTLVKAPNNKIVKLGHQLDQVLKDLEYKETDSFNDNKMETEASVVENADSEDFLSTLIDQELLQFDNTIKKNSINEEEWLNDILF